jgi:hypothetical protein
MASEPNRQYVLHTERLILRLSDPFQRKDCEQIVQTFLDPKAGQGGNERVGVSSVEDVRYKYERNGPRAEGCTRAPPPRGHIFMMFQRQANETGKDVEGGFAGVIAMSFRREMPYPDLGWAVFGKTLLGIKRPTAWAGCAVSDPSSCTKLKLGCNSSSSTPSCLEIITVNLRDNPLASSETLADYP